MKTCANPDCNQVNPQPLSNFSSSRRNKDKLKVRCKSCRNLQAREWYKKVKQEQPEKHREMIDSKSEYHKVRQQTKKPYLMRKFGITLDTYNNMLAAQHYKCAICGIHKDMLDRPLGVDHNHSTLKVRGLLCNPCNVSFGLLRENTDTMRAMIAYADFYEGQNG